MVRFCMTLALLGALLGGGIAHASIAHGHGEHAHSAEESSTWTQLHGSLRHEDKQIFAAVDDFSPVWLGSVMKPTGDLISLHTMSDKAQQRDPMARESLRKGVDRYRVFG